MKSPGHKKLELNYRLKRGTPLKSPKVVALMNPKSKITKKITPCRDIKGPVTPLRKKQEIAGAIDVIDDESPELSSPPSSRRLLRRSMNQSPVKSSHQKKSNNSAKTPSNHESLTDKKNANKTPVRMSKTMRNNNFGEDDVNDVKMDEDKSPPPTTRTLKRTPLKMNKSHSNTTTTLSTSKRAGAEKLNTSTSRSPRAIENKMVDEDANNTSVHRSPRKKVKVGLILLFFFNYLLC